MAGTRSFEKVIIDRSLGDEVTKTVRLEEGGAMGEFSVWNRRTNGTAITTFEIFGSFVNNPTEDERYSIGWGSTTANDYLDTNIWGWYLDFSYLTFVVNFENSEEPPPPPEDPEEEPPPVLPEPGTVEFYVTCY